MHWALCLKCSLDENGNGFLAGRQTLTVEVYVRIQGILLGVVVGLAVQQHGVEAATYLYNFGSVFRGHTPAPASAPWVTAQLADVGPGLVQLTIAASHLTRRESIGSLFLNLDPALNPSLLVFNRINSEGSFRSPKIRARTDAFSVPGAGQFDLRFQFTGLGSNARRFGSGDQVTYLISGIPGLNASSFGFSSLTPCNGDSLSAAAQIRGIPPHHRSGWIYPAEGLTAVPEPASGVLFAAAVLISSTLVALRRPRH